MSEYQCLRCKTVFRVEMSIADQRGAGVSGVQHYGYGSKGRCRGAPARWVRDLDGVEKTGGNR
ncbi:hypothetical protein LCGC14_1753940 [marine sediment metagenome]|uniref:Uncharacterized protein n=1 Tax=marine sediment metagenome TaxID=412755 RepID=A0A0F9K2L5_9ZZZZ